MTPRLPFLTAWLATLTAFAQMPAPPEVKLQTLTCPAPALMGHLGNEAAGQAIPIDALHLHQGGPIMGTLTTKAFGGLMTHLSTWERDPKYPRLLFRGLLNVGCVWCMSGKGDLLCAQSEVEVDRHDLPAYFAHNPGALGCFRWSDGRRLWALPYDHEEELTEAAFSGDDKVLVTVIDRGRSQTIVRLHDPVTGTELRRQALDRGEHRQNFYPGARRLVVRVKDLFLMRAVGMQNFGGPQELVRLPFDTLQPEVVPCPWIKDGDDSDHDDLLSLSPDGHWLALHRREGYAVLEEKGGTWVTVLSGVVGTDPNTGFNLDEITAAEFSPDSRSLVVLGAHGGKVIDLAAHKVVNKLGPNCNRGLFSPDGSTFATAMHSSTALWNTKDWKLIDKPQPPLQHTCPVKGVRFLADGHSLVSWDHNGLILWDVATRKPKAALRPRKDQHICGDSFDSIALINHGTEVVAGDGWDFLRWRLPALGGPAPLAPATILSDPAFPGPPNQARDAIRMSVVADAEGRRIMALTKSSAAIHDLQTPGVVKTVQINNVNSKSTLATFSADGKSLSYIGNASDVWKQIDLATGTTSDLPKSDSGQIMGATLMLPRSGAVLWNYASAFIIKELATGKVLHRIARPSSSLLLFPQGAVAVSKDEQRIAALVMSSENGQRYIGVWQKEGGTLIALQALPSNEATCMAFSPDGKILACGHNHTAVSLWDVEKLIETAKPELLIPPAPALAQRQTSAPTIIERSSSDPLEAARLFLGLQHAELPNTPQPVNDTDKWTFLPNGVVSMGERLPAAGKLFVGSVETASHALRYGLDRYKGQVTGFSIIARNLLANEGPALDGKLWVSRQFGEPPGIHAPWMIFTDTFTNVSPETVSTTLEFEVQFPVDTKELVDSNFKKISIDAGGRLTLDPSVRWIAPSGSGKPGDSLPLLCFWSPGAATQPRVHWDPARQAVHVQHDLVIGPGEKRYTAHLVHLLKRDPQQKSDVFQQPLFDDFPTFVEPSTRERGVNFGKLVPEYSWPPRFVRSPTPLPERDSMGFLWSELPDRSREGQLGAQSVFQLWIDGSPLPFSGSSLFPHLTPSPNIGLASLAQIPLRGQTLDGKTAITRYPVGMGNNKALSVWNDLFTNSSDAAVVFKVSLATSFATPPVELWDAHGKLRPLDHQLLSGSDLGGACAIVSPGDQKPATVLVFHREGSAADPHLRWIGDRMVAVEYTLSIPPHGSQLLRHGACQRPLGAFKSPADAMADCMPLRPETFPAALRITNLPSPANYHQ